jgi:hypothetical protein
VATRPAPSQKPCPLRRGDAHPRDHDLRRRRNTLQSRASGKRGAEGDRVTARAGGRRHASGRCVPQSLDWSVRARLAFRGGCDSRRGPWVRTCFDHFRPRHRAPYRSGIAAETSSCVTQRRVAEGSSRPEGGRPAGASGATRGADRWRRSVLKSKPCLGQSRGRTLST